MFLDIAFNLLLIMDLAAWWGKLCPELQEVALGSLLWMPGQLIPYQLMM